MQLCLPIGTTRQEILRTMERKGREVGENQGRLCSLFLLWTQFPHWYPKGATMVPSSTTGLPIPVTPDAVVREA